MCQGEGQAQAYRSAPGSGVSHVFPPEPGGVKSMPCHQLQEWDMPRPPPYIWEGAMPNPPFQLQEGVCRRFYRQPLPAATRLRLLHLHGRGHAHTYDPALGGGDAHASSSASGGGQAHIQSCYSRGASPRLHGQPLLAAARLPLVASEWRGHVHSPHPHTHTNIHVHSKIHTHPLSNTRTTHYISRRGQVHAFHSVTHTHMRGHTPTPSRRCTHMSLRLQP